MESSIFCPNCSKKLAAGTNFCPDCGFNIKKISNIIEQSREVLDLDLPPSLKISSDEEQEFCPDSRLLDSKIISNMIEESDLELQKAFMEDVEFVENKLDSKKQSNIESREEAELGLALDLDLDFIPDLQTAPVEELEFVADRLLEQESDISTEQTMIEESGSKIKNETCLSDSDSEDFIPEKNKNIATEKTVSVDKKFHSTPIKNKINNSTQTPFFFCPYCGNKLKNTKVCVICGADCSSITPSKNLSNSIDNIFGIKKEPDIIGKTFGRCKVEEKIGQGGMGAIYKAYHQTLDQHVVLKILPPTMAVSEELRERFLREARACAKLHHQNIVQILDAGFENNIYFYIMEYIEGFSLEEIVEKQEKLELKEACTIIRDAAVGLSLAHCQGIIHRDIKASNIMIDKQGVVKVTDFGLAYDNEAKKISATGRIMGTPQYMPPEQWESKNITNKSDLYSLGITFFYILSGELPFDSSSTFSLMKQHISEIPPSIKQYRADIPPVLENIILKLLSKNQEDRYTDCDELIEDINSFLNSLENKESIEENLSNSDKVIPLRPLMFFCFIILFFSISYKLITKSKIINIAKDTNSSKKQSSSTNKINSLEGNKTKKTNLLDENKTKKKTKNIIIYPEHNTTEQTEDNKTIIPGEHNKTAIPQKEKIKKVEHNKTKKDSHKIEIIELPDIKLKALEKNHYNSFPITLSGESNKIITKRFQILIIISKKTKKGYTLTKRITPSLSPKTFRANIEFLKDGLYEALAVIRKKSRHRKEKKFKKSNSIAFRIDTKKPTCKIVYPHNREIFKEEKTGKNIKISAEAKDDESGITTVYVVNNSNKKILKRKNGIFFSDINLKWGKQNFDVLCVDRAGNKSKTTRTIFLIPKKMVRIPSGQIPIHNKEKKFDSFYIDRTEVTNEEFKKYVEATGDKPKNWEENQNKYSWGKLPVTMVTYNQAKKYSEYINKRLPTEVEWVAAALWDGKKLKEFPWGKESEVKWSSRILPVGSWKKDISFWGIKGMATNAAEWIADTKENKALIKGGDSLTRPGALKKMKWYKFSREKDKFLPAIWLGFRCALTE